MLLGLRGTGKTVLLNRFTAIAKKEGVQIAFMEASDTGSFCQLLAIRLRRVLLGLAEGLAEGPIRRVTARALGALRSFALQLPDGSSISVGVEAMPGLADSGVLSEDLTDLLVTTGEAAAENNSGIVITIDEAQYLSDEEMGAIIAAVHRTTQLDLPVVLTAAGLPQLRALAGQARTYTERLFTFPEVGALTPDETRDALILPAEAEHIQFEPEAIEKIIAESMGYPYFVQEWGSHAWNAAPKNPITVQDVHTASQSVTDTLDQDFFRVRFDRLTPKEREYLQAMAELGPGPHRSGDIATKLDTQVHSVAPRRAALINKSIIYSPAHGDTAFTAPLFNDFLKRTLSKQT